MAYNSTISISQIQAQQQIIREEDKRILISKRVLNFWGVFLSQGAITVTISALIIWFTKHFSIGEDGAISLQISNTEIFLYAFLLTIQYIIYHLILVWRSGYMLDLLKLSKNQIRTPFQSNGWNKNEEGLLLLSTILGSLMLVLSIYLLETFIA